MISYKNMYVIVRKRPNIVPERKWEEESESCFELKALNESASYFVSTICRMLVCVNGRYLFSERKHLIILPEKLLVFLIVMKVLQVHDNRKTFPRNKSRSERSWRMRIFQFQQSEPPTPFRAKFRSEQSVLKVSSKSSIG